LETVLNFLVLGTKTKTCKRITIVRRGLVYFKNWKQKLFQTDS